MIEALFEKSFVSALKKHSNIKNVIERKVRQIIENPVMLGEPLKGDWRGFFSCPVKKNFIIIYLYCECCRKKGDYLVVACSDCAERGDETIKFVLLAPHEEAYGKRLNY